MSRIDILEGSKWYSQRTGDRPAIWLNTDSFCDNFKDVMEREVED